MHFCADEHISRSPRFVFDQFSALDALVFCFDPSLNASFIVVFTGNLSNQQLESLASADEHEVVQEVQVRMKKENKIKAAPKRPKSDLFVGF